MATRGKGNIYHIKIYCAQCNTYLFKYRKEKRGSLVRCYIENIVEDKTGGDLKCPGCSQEFARFKMERARPSNRMIQGKTYIKGHLKK